MIEKITNMSDGLFRSHPLKPIVQDEVIYINRIERRFGG